MSDLSDFKKVDSAMWHLRQALEDTSTSDEVFESLLELDMIGLFYQPWETAARKLEYTEYEVTEGIQSKREEKIKALRRQQKQVNEKFGIFAVTPSGTVLTSRRGSARGTTTARYIVKP